MRPVTSLEANPAIIGSCTGQLLGKTWYPELFRVLTHETASCGIPGGGLRPPAACARKSVVLKPRVRVRDSDVRRTRLQVTKNQTRNITRPSNSPPTISRAATSDEGEVREPALH